MNRREFPLTAAAGATPEANRAATRAPNLLFIMADQFRADAMSCAGNTKLPTPNLDRLAREGARFQDANCAFPLIENPADLMIHFRHHSVINRGELPDAILPIAPDTPAARTR